MPLNLIAVDVVAGPQARILPLAPGLDEDWFDHDGQITKAEIRAITLARARPRAGELLWDIGAGSGSVALEWCLRHPRNRTIAFEEKPERAERIAPQPLEPGGAAGRDRAGAAPAAFAGTPTPDAVFIGGGIGDAGLFEARLGRAQARRAARRQCRDAGGRGAAGGAVRGAWRVACAASASAISTPVGTLHGWRPAMPVTQWRVVKP